MRFPQLDNYEKAAIGLSLVVLALLLWISQFHEIGGYGVETDFYGSYAWDAENLLKGRALEEPDHGPIYTFVLAAFILVFGDTFLAAKMISVLSAIGFGLLSFKVLQTLFDSKRAFYTMLLVFVSLTPFAILASQDVFIAFLVTLSIYIFFRGNRISRSNLFWSGAISAVALLTRYDAAIVPVGVLMILLIVNPEDRSFSERLKSFGIFTAAFFMLFLPWLLFNLIQHGHPLPTRLYTAVGAYYYGGFENKIGGEGMQYGASKFDSMFSIIFGDLKHFVVHFFRTVVRHFEKLMVLLVKFPGNLVIVPGCILFLTRANKKQIGYFVFPTLGFLILCLTIFNPRYYLYFFPFVFFFVVYFSFSEDLVEKSIGIWQRFRVGHLLVALFFGVVAFNVQTAVRQTKSNVQEEPVELIEVAQHLKAVAHENDLIIARKPHLGFLAGLRTAYFPEVDSVEEVIRYARAIGARYLLYSYVEAEMRPQLEALAVSQNAHSDLRIVYEGSRPLIKLYEIKI